MSYLWNFRGNFLLLFLLVFVMSLTWCTHHNSTWGDAMKLTGCQNPRTFWLVSRYRYTGWSVCVVFVFFLFFFGGGGETSATALKYTLKNKFLQFFVYTEYSLSNDISQKQDGTSQWPRRSEAWWDCRSTRMWPRETSGWKSCGSAGWMMMRYGFSCARKEWPRGWILVWVTGGSELNILYCIVLTVHLIWHNYKYVHIYLVCCYLVLYM